LGAALALEVGEQLAVSSDQDAGAVNDEGDLIIAVAPAGQEDDAREGGEVVFDGAQGMVETLCDLIRF
jgi:hypothetical protein